MATRDRVVVLGARCASWGMFSCFVRSIVSARRHCTACLLNLPLHLYIVRKVLGTASLPMAPLKNVSCSFTSLPRRCEELDETWMRQLSGGDAIGVVKLPLSFAGGYRETCMPFKPPLLYVSDSMMETGPCLTLVALGARICRPTR